MPTQFVALLPKLSGSDIRFGVKPSGHAQSNDFGWNLVFHWRAAFRTISPTVNFGRTTTIERVRIPHVIVYNS